MVKLETDLLKLSFKHRVAQCGLPLKLSPTVLPEIERFEHLLKLYHLKGHRHKQFSSIARLLRTNVHGRKSERAFLLRAQRSTVWKSRVNNDSFLVHRMYKPQRADGHPWGCRWASSPWWGCWLLDRCCWVHSDSACTEGCKTRKLWAQITTTTSQQKVQVRSCHRCCDHMWQSWFG